MKKRTAIDVLGGNMSAAARNIGCTPEAVRRWPTDNAGNIVSRHIADTVLATLVRMNYRHMLANPDGVRYEFDFDTLADLLQLPEDEIHILTNSEE